MMTAELIPIKIPHQFHPDDKVFYFTDEEGNPIGEKFSRNDHLKRIEALSGVNDELLGPA